VLRTKFDFTEAPIVSLYEYLCKVQTAIGCSEKTVLVAIIYMQWYFDKKNEQFRVSAYYNANLLFTHTYQNSY
jgi:uncharacterized protein YozE (UPF0346 family)